MEKRNSFFGEKKSAVVENTPEIAQQLDSPNQEAAPPGVCSVSRSGPGCDKLEAEWVSEVEHSLSDSL